MGFDYLHQLERNRHFWIQGKHLIIKDLVNQAKPGSLLDIGCGTGSLLLSLSSKVDSITGIDLSEKAVKHCRQIMPQANFVEGEATQLRFADNSFDLVLALDVIEHVSEDKSVISEAYRVLKPGGRLILSAPAFPWLFSQRDSAAGHLRRYRRSELVSLLKDSDLKTDYLNYYIFFLFPLLILSRLLRLPEKDPAPFLNSFFTFICQAEAKMSRYISFPWGSTLITVARKKNV